MWVPFTWRLVLCCWRSKLGLESTRKRAEEPWVCCLGQQLCGKKQQFTTERERQRERRKLLGAFGVLPLHWWPLRGDRFPAGGSTPPRYIFSVYSAIFCVYVMRYDVFWWLPHFPQLRFPKRYTPTIYSCKYLSSYTHRMYLMDAENKNYF